MYYPCLMDFHAYTATSIKSEQLWLNSQAEYQSWQMGCWMVHAEHSSMACGWMCTRPGGTDSHWCKHASIHETSINPCRAWNLGGGCMSSEEWSIQSWGIGVFHGDPVSARKQPRPYLLDMEFCWGLMLCRLSLVLVSNENEKSQPMIVTTVCQLG